MEKLNISNNPKKCACCETIHNEVPSNARVHVGDAFAGFYWECACKSTLFYPAHALTQNMVDISISYRNFLYNNYFNRK